MALLIACQACTPAEDLHSSRGKQHRPLIARRKRSQMWLVGTWNVRSVVDAVGSLAIASRKQNGQRAEDRKVDMVVRELKRYK